MILMLQQSEMQFIILIMAIKCESEGVNYVVAVPIDRELAEFFGKKSSEDSVSFYNRKVDSNVIVALAPSNPEEKFYSIGECISSSEQVLISTKQIDASFGEVLVAASLSGKRIIATSENDISKFVSDLGIKDITVASKESIIERILDYKSAPVSGPTKVEIDHAFPVKGVGTVLLGIVIGGTLHTHDKLIHNSGKEVYIKSIQSQDIDINDAERGTRVGLAVKGIEVEEIKKGDILATAQIPKTAAITIEPIMSKFSKDGLKEGTRYGMVSRFSYVDATAGKADGKSVVIELQRPIPLEKGDRVLFIRQEKPRIFCAGTVTSIG